MGGSSNKSDESFLDYIEEYCKESDLSVKEDIANYEKELEQKYLLDIELKKRLSEFTVKHKLDVAIIELFDSIKHYESWRKRDDFVNELNVHEVVKTENEESKEVKITFKWNHINYQLLYSEEECWLPDDSWTNAIFSLLEDNDLVFKIKSTIHYDYCTTYKLSSVEAFKKRGSWGKLLVDSWMMRDIREKKRAVESRYYGAKNIKGNFQE